MAKAKEKNPAVDRMRARAVVDPDGGGVAIEFGHMHPSKDEMEPAEFQVVGGAGRTLDTDEAERFAVEFAEAANKAGSDRAMRLAHEADSPEVRSSDEPTHPADESAAAPS